MVLVDTSVWVEVFRDPGRVVLEKVVRFDEIVTCLPVIQEVLQGFDDEHAFRRARSAMRALPIVESPLDEEVFLEAASLYRSCRRVGVTIRSSVDCLIAVCAMRHSLTVLHADRDFHAISQVAPLTVKSIR